MLVRFLVVLLGVAAAHSFRPAIKSEKQTVAKNGFAADDLQLGLTVVPSAYDLTLTTHIDKFDDNEFTFEGEITISVKISEDVDSIVLHRHDSISIKAMSALFPEATSSVELVEVSYDNTTNKMTLKQKAEGKNFPKNDVEYKIMLSYQGTHGNDMSGFYRSYYVDDKNNSRWLATTQFEAYDARKAFPCFDEPRFKALYTIAVKVPTVNVKDGYHALSNMPLIEPTTEDGEYTVYKFQPSAKKLSSYLVAFIVSDFKCTDPKKFSGDLEFRTCGRTTYIDASLADLSQLAGTECLQVIAGFVNGIPYAYPKMDQVGIPDFSAGAMENWGLATYRERILFYDAKKSSLANKQNIITTTVHEMAHQWFGDLVTLFWWSDIWLNEGFATFFEYHATDLIRGDGLNTSNWDMIGQMLNDEVQAGALTLDAQPNTRALTNEVASLPQIDATFDNIAYSKGGSVIRMWMHVLGPETFKSGLNHYLTTNSEQVGNPQLLLDSFKTVANTTMAAQIDGFMSWITQPGYPVVTAKLNNTLLTFTQEHFLVSDDGDKDRKWQVPISYTTSASPNFDETTPTEWLLDEKPKEVTIEAADWAVVNIQETGYYRVNYNEENWQALTEVLHTDHTKIHPYNRAQILDDVLWMARSKANYTNYNIALNITNYLKNERSLIAWNAGLNGLNFLYWKLANNDDGGEKIKNHILNLIGDTYAELGLAVGATEEHTNQLLRPIIASWACRLEHEDCLSAAQDLYDGVESLLAIDGEKFSPDVRNVVICSAIRQGDESVWNSVMEAYNRTVDNAEQTLFLSTLGCTGEETLLKRFLEMTLKEDSPIRKQDRVAVFSSVYNGNPGNVQTAFQFLQDNLDAIADNYGGMDPLGSVLTGIAAKLGVNEDLDKFNTLLKKIEESKNPNVQRGSTSAKTALDIIQSNNNWYNTKETEASAWLEENSAISNTVTLLALLLPAIVAIFNNY